MNRRVVVTGMGAITPIGLTVSDFWKSLIEGANGVDYITRFDTSQFTTKFAAEVKDFDPTRYIERKLVRRMDLFTQYGVAAAKEAIEESGLDLKEEDPFRIGVIVGSGIGGLNKYEIEHRKLISNGPQRVSPFLIPMMISNITPGYISMIYGVKGINYAPVSACATAAHAVGLGFREIKFGGSDVIITGGSEAALTHMGVAGFNAMHALSEENDHPQKASRPFDGTRNGFVMGEGGAIVVLEALEHAKARGAKILAEVVGVGMTADAYHITAPDPEAEGAVNAMAFAIREAGLQPAEIDYINAHGTSTPHNDRMETKAIKKVFGDDAYRVAISSNKSMIGHMLGAGGAIEFIASVLTIRNGIVPPTINYEHPDPECDLNYTPNKAVKRDVRTAISNSFGFGGHNVTLAVQRYED
ncbi:3-oxoacyl-[acyl-carrier-protein] synthase 2 [bacterium BMS3Abin05]|nr:3-oxoacyl-[acyl-carrier-protein] synthase 2 [bacterium BMS3Abin05]GBE27112.1 3-oxoacyl-[acyl-carrier-protein] synthase 2 [bacterium BMS3Bbin03]HDZ11282.1 beta-ketoacyl-[acyl-carrier-protein] synthase II [Bacteroidota bacterium]